MLSLSTKLNYTSLLNVAMHLGMFGTSRIMDVLRLVEMGSVEEIPWVQRLQFSNLFMKHGLVDKAMELISNIDHPNVDTELRPEEILPFAILMANCGKINFAEKIIETAYNENSAIKNAYANLAWYYYHKRGNYRSALKCMRKDHSLKRISSNWSIKLAVEFAFNSKISEAKTIVSQAYDSDPDLKDGNAEIAKLLYWPQEQYERAATWFEYDKVTGRLSDSGKLLYVQLLVAAGKVKYAESLVQRSTDVDVLANIALGERLNGKFDNSLINFEKIDYSKNVSGKIKMEYALGLLLCNRYEKAKSIIVQHQLNGSKVAIKRHKVFMASGCYKPNYAKIVELCQLDFDLQSSSFQTWMRILIFQLLAKDLSGAKNTLNETSKSYPEHKTKIEVTFILWLNIAKIEEPEDCSALLNDISLETMDCFSLLETTVASLLLKKNILADLALHRLYELNPSHFLIKSIPVFNNINFLGFVAHHYGRTDISEKCAEYSEQKTPGYVYLREFVSKSKRSEPVSLKCELPKFAFPWKK